MASLTDFNTREGRNNDFKVRSIQIIQLEDKQKRKRKKSKSPKPWNNIRTLRYL